MVILPSLSLVKNVLRHVTGKPKKIILVCHFLSGNKIMVYTKDPGKKLHNSLVSEKKKRKE